MKEIKEHEHVFNLKDSDELYCIKGKIQLEMVEILNSKWDQEVFEQLRIRKLAIENILLERGIL